MGPVRVITQAAFGAVPSLPPPPPPPPPTGIPLPTAIPIPVATVVPPQAGPGVPALPTVTTTGGNVLPGGGQLVPQGTPGSVPIRNVPVFRDPVRGFILSNPEAVRRAEIRGRMLPTIPQATPTQPGPVAQLVNPQSVPLAMAADQTPDLAEELLKGMRRGVLNQLIKSLRKVTRTGPELLPFVAGHEPYPPTYLKDYSRVDVESRIPPRVSMERILSDTLLISRGFRIDASTGVIIGDERLTQSLGEGPTTLSASKGIEGKMPRSLVGLESPVAVQEARDGV